MGQRNACMMDRHVLANVLKNTCSIHETNVFDWALKERWGKDKWHYFQVQPLDIPQQYSSRGYGFLALSSICQMHIPEEHPGGLCTTGFLHTDWLSLTEILTAWLILHFPLMSGLISCWPLTHTYWILQPWKMLFLLTHGDFVAKLHPDLRGWSEGDKFRSFLF